MSRIDYFVPRPKVDIKEKDQDKIYSRKMVDEKIDDLH